jgi:cell division protein FtsL
MMRLHLALVAALIASALGLVHTAYETRQLFAELERSRNELVRLDAEFKRLEAERQAQATHLRVERVARERLSMRTVTPAVTHVVSDTGVTKVEAKR